jgi:hypothetical protein
MGTDNSQDVQGALNFHIKNKETIAYYRMIIGKVGKTPSSKV